MFFFLAKVKLNREIEIKFHLEFYSAEASIPQKHIFFSKKDTPILLCILFTEVMLLLNNPIP